MTGEGLPRNEGLPTRDDEVVIPLPVAGDSPTVQGVGQQPLPPEDVGEPASLVKSLLYGLSIPERMVRGAVGLTAGAVKELATAIVPTAFQDSASYRIAVTNSLGFLTETIGGVAPHKSAVGSNSSESADVTSEGLAIAPDLAATTAETPVEIEAGRHIAKKAVGNFIDLAGLATLHVSPLWMMAIVSDVCYGSKTYVLELAVELKRQGVIDDTSTIHHVDDILSAVQKATGTAASSFDTPPFSIEELRKTLSDTTDALSEADLRRLLPESEMRSLWNEMRQVADQENVSLLGVSGAIAMQTLNRAATVGHGAIIGVQVAGGILNRNVLQHYVDSLVRIQERGFYPMLKESYGPYVEAVWNNFSTERATWTESLLNPTNLGAWFSKGLGLFSSAPTNPEPTTKPDTPM